MSEREKLTFNLPELLQNLIHAALLPNVPPEQIELAAKIYADGLRAVNS